MGRDLPRILLLAVAYFIAAKAGLKLAVVHANATAVWPPTGLSLAALLLYGRRLWPGVFLGALAANVTTDVTAGTAIGIACGNTLEALAGTWWLERRAGGARCLESAPGVFSFGLAALLSPAVSATLGTASLCYGGAASWASFGDIWATWWLGDAGGDFVVAPLLLTWLQPRAAGSVWERERSLEAAAAFVALALVGAAVFTASPGLSFVCMPLLVWVAFRFGPRETAAALALLSAIAVAGSLFGPDAADAYETLPDIQAFMGVTAVTSLAIAAMVAQLRLNERAERAELVLKERTEDLLRSNAELETFAAVASHDLQEPLRKIQLFGDRLMETSSAALDPQGRDHLARIRNSAARMSQLIDDLLQYSRITMKAQPFEPVDLGVVAREALGDLDARIEQTGARVDLEMLPTVRGDPAQLRRLFLNLIGNSLKFHRKGVPPVVVVRSRPAKPAGIEIEVRDNGIGFEEKYLDRIFRPFQRLHPRSEYEGSGVGLAICHKIAQRHGGSVGARSVPGEGSVFLVRLPL